VTSNRDVTRAGLVWLIRRGPVAEQLRRQQGGLGLADQARPPLIEQSRRNRGGLGQGDRERPPVIE